ncbi:phosphatase PAP2 family protein [Oceanobacillus halotolerans]|uniref:phosphatase PAP2 family protein n=1 Tax=Oceanobacillus halotolerans TaxID=2663380 RepID=UPI0013DAF3E8|nr:phosphatase PAP2 family protein [Oceanobacillus halotolerans]
MLKNRHYFVLFFFLIVSSTIAIWVTKIVRGQVPYIDQWTRAYVDTVADTIVYETFLQITDLGSEEFLVPFTIVVGILLFLIFRDWRPAFVFAGGTLGAHLLNLSIKAMVGRERPSILIEANAEGHSFPSGHAMIPMVCYGLLSYFISRRLKHRYLIITIQVFFALLVFLIGVSRYYINVHYLTDVVAGFILGFILLISLIYGYEKWMRYRARSKTSN